jgi:malate-CoA ligase subunit alpha
MSILLDEKTPVLVQGFTGTIGGFHAKEMLDYGTNVVGGVTPGKGGTTHLGKPVFNSLKVAVAETGAVASIVFVPPPFAADAIMEAADAGIRLCVCITDGIPAQDMIRVKRYLRRYKRHRRMRLIGPNCAGVISPGKAMMGIMPGHIYTPGRVGIVGRSGTLGYEAAAQMQALGIGVSTSVGIGGDPINGSSFKDILELFQEDDETDRLRGGFVSAQGTAHGSCRRHHLRLRRERLGEGGDPQGRRHRRRPQSGGDGRFGPQDPEGTRFARGVRRSATGHFISNTSNQ